MPTRVAAADVKNTSDTTTCTGPGFARQKDSPAEGKSNMQAHGLVSEEAEAHHHRQQVRCHHEGPNEA